MNRFTFVDCATVDEALSQMKGDAVVKAGGIDLLDLMKDGIVSPPKLVSILNVQSLHRVGFNAALASVGSGARAGVLRVANRGCILERRPQLTFRGYQPTLSSQARDSAGRTARPRTSSAGRACIASSRAAAARHGAGWRAPTSTPPGRPVTRRRGIRHPRRRTRARRARAAPGRRGSAPRR